MSRSVLQANKLSKREGYRYLQRSFTTYKRLFYAQCIPSRTCLPTHLRRGCRYPFFPQAAGAVPQDCLLPGQAPLTGTGETCILVSDIVHCPSLNPELHLPWYFTAAQDRTSGVFTRHYLMPIHTD